MMIGISVAITGQLATPRYTYQNAYAAAAAARMDYKPSPSVGAVYDTLCATLEAAGAFASFDALYFFALGDMQPSLINLSQNRFDCIAVNSPVFVPYRGFSFDGIASYLDSLANPLNSGSMKFLQDDANMWIWPTTNLANGANQSSDIGTGQARMSRSAANNGVAVRTNSGTTDTGINSGANGYPGPMGWARSGASAVNIYKETATVNTLTTASTGHLNETIRFGQAGSGGFGVNNLVAGGFGKNIDLAMFAAVRNAFHTALLSVGAV